MSTWWFRKLLLDQCCLASEREATSIIPTTLPLSKIMTRPLIMMILYSMKIFIIKTFGNCPETAKLAKVFTRKRFALYGTFIKEDHPRKNLHQKHHCQLHPEKNTTLEQVFTTQVHLRPCKAYICHDWRPLAQNSHPYVSIGKCMTCANRHVLIYVMNGSHWKWLPIGKHKRAV